MSDREVIIVDPLKLLPGELVGPFVDHGLVREPFWMNEIPTEDEVTAIHRHLMLGTKKRIVHLVAVRAADRPVSDEQLRIEQVLGEELWRWGTGNGVTVVRGVLAVLTDGGTIDCGQLRAEWEYNVVLPPYESIGEEGFGLTPIHDAERLPWLLFIGIGLGCGLFTFTDRGLFDDAVTDLVGGVPYVRALELYLRIVDGGDMVGRVIALAFDGTEEVWPTPEGLTSHPQPELAIQQIANEVGTVLDLGYQRQGLGAPDSGPTISIKEAVVRFAGLLFRMMGDEAFSAAYEAADRSVTRLETAVQANTLGENSETTVSASARGMRPMWNTADSEDRMRQLDRLPGVEIPSPTANTEVWTTLRSVLFGLADGGPFDGRMVEREPMIAQQRTVIPEKALLIEPPRDRGGDDDLLDEDQARSDDEGDPDGSQVEQLTTGTVEEDPPGVDSPEPDEASSDAPDDSAESDEPTSPPFPPSLWTQVERRLEDGLGAAWAAAVTIPAEWKTSIAAVAEAREEMAKARRRVRWFTIGLVMVLVALAGAEVFLVIRDHPKTRLWTTLAIGLLGIMIMMMGSIIATQNYHKAVNRMRAENRRVEHLLREHSRAIDQFIRLSYIRHQTEDWREILATSLHSPLATEALAIELEEPLEDPGIVNAVVGGPSVTANGWRRAAMDMRRSILQVGWLDRIYRQYVEVWRNHFEEMKVYRDPARYDPDRDPTIIPTAEPIPGTDDVIYDSRHQLRADLRSGNYRVEAFERFRLGHERSTEANLIDTVIASVECSHVGLDGRSLEHFLGGLLESTAEGSFAKFANGAAERDRLTVHNETLNAVSSHPTKSEPIVTDQPTEGLQALERRMVLASYRARLSPPCRYDELSFVSGRLGSTPNEPKPGSGPVL